MVENSIDNITMFTFYYHWNSSDLFHIAIEWPFCSRNWNAFQWNSIKTCCVDCVALHIDWIFRNVWYELQSIYFKTKTIYSSIFIYIVIYKPLHKLFDGKNSITNLGSVSDECCWSIVWRKSLFGKNVNAKKTFNVIWPTEDNVKHLQYSRCSFISFDWKKFIFVPGIPKSVANAALTLDFSPKMKWLSANNMCFIVTMCKTLNQIFETMFSSIFFRSSIINYRHQSLLSTLINWNQRNWLRKQKKPDQVCGYFITVN